MKISSVPNRKPGRPRFQRPAHPLAAATKAELIKRLGISTETFYSWLSESQEAPTNDEGLSLVLWWSWATEHESLRAHNRGAVGSFAEAIDGLEPTADNAPASDSELTAWTIAWLVALHQAVAELDVLTSTRLRPIQAHAAREAVGSVYRLYHTLHRALFAASPEFQAAWRKLDPCMAEGFAPKADP